MSNDRNQPPVSPLGYQSEKQQAPAAGQQDSGLPHVGETIPLPNDVSYTQPLRSDASYTQPLHSADPAARAYAGQATAVNPAVSADAGKKKKKGGTGKTFLAGFLGAALACALGLGGFALANGGLGKSSSSPSVTLGATSSSSINASSSEDRAVAVANKVLPSVVGIDVYTQQSTGGSYLDQFFGSGSSSSSSDTLTYSGLGSGVVISEDGYIITNYHVVEGSADLVCNINGEEYQASVVGTDASSDLAVIKVEATGLTPIEIGSSADLVQGQWVMSAGSPFGLEQSVATGIISATSRTVTVDNSYDGYYSSGSEGSVSVYADMIQTDAAINPGNSGGALVDENGKLVGINSLFSSSSGNYAGVGFAIPVDYAMNIAQQIIAGETPSHAMLGVSVTTVNSSIAQRYGLAADKGAYVTSVYEGSPAAECGLQQGDIITKLNDTAIENSTDLTGACRSHQIGDKVTVTYNRDGQTQTAEATLGSDQDYVSQQTDSSQDQQDQQYQQYQDQGQSQDQYLQDYLRQYLQQYGY